MSKINHQPAPHITPEMLKDIKAKVTALYVNSINPDELKTPNNWYALIINTRIGEGPVGAKYYNSLDVVIGTSEAKLLTDTILNTIRATFTTVDI